ncbi:S1 family serine peptidase [Aspergillus puulaauensis]|uniref:Peptidase S1 domain-containing protein n=1 Tax=Aspergillus puulaauensis TaxID=1220207 RepID=A0A7R7X9X5_9EURO|nr:uncharacterized protein APUU_10168S [Aspergillus puulaauensis]BCS17340.1 hypothetical protein APUU_10168S [Aspergillus puulaauensis]
MKVSNILLPLLTSVISGAFAGEFIIGGDDTEIESYPYQISLHQDGEHNCGGSIVSKTHIVTAGHCLARVQNTSQLGVRAGSTYHAHGGQLLNVSAYHVHPRFNQTSLTHDVAVIKLSEPLELGPAVAPIRLASASAGYPETGTITNLTGWGSTDVDTPSLPDTLQVLEFPVADRGECIERWQHHKYQPLNVTDTMFCLSSFKDEETACHGDSGGPVAVDGTLVGIVSWGEPTCGSDYYPSVYSSVSVLRGWIDAQLRG